MKNNDVLIFALTIKANPKTISKTEIKLLVKEYNQLTTQEKKSSNQKIS